MLESFSYIVHKEDGYYVSQCLDVDISSFGRTIAEAVDNLQEALELYFGERDYIEEIRNKGTGTVGEKD